MALVGLGILIAVSAGLVLSRGTARGTTFTVNVRFDEAGSNPGDGVSTGILTSGVCVLRAAIQEANTLAGDDSLTVPAGTSTLTSPHGGAVSMMLERGVTFAGLTGADGTAISDLIAARPEFSALLPFDGPSQDWRTSWPWEPAFLSSSVSVDRLQGLFIFNPAAAVLSLG